MMIFVHMHKCAGSTVVRKARNAGLRLPAQNHNGNLLSADGKHVRYDHLPREDLHRLLERQQADGVEFFAMEWDFPAVEDLEAAPTPVEIFTVVRDPYDRAVSNYRFAKLTGAVRKDVVFQEFMNWSYSKSGPLARSSNYFVRKLSAADSVAPLDETHLDRAMTVLGRFRAAIVLGAQDLDVELAKIGISAEAKVAKRTSELKRKAISPERLEVSAADRTWFLEENRLDIALIDRLKAAIPTMEADACSGDDQAVA